MNEFDLALNQSDSVEALSEEVLNATHIVNDDIGQEILDQENTGSILEPVADEIQPQNTPKRANQANEPLDPEKPVNLIELVKEQGILLQSLNEKSQRLESMKLDAEGKGLLTDFKNQLSALDDKTLKIMAYFSENISNEDRALINRTLLLKQNLSELYDLIKYFESKD